MKWKVCPDCGEDNKPSDYHCWKCGHPFSGETTSTLSRSTAKQSSPPKVSIDSEIPCKECGAPNPEIARYCSNCGNEMQSFEDIQARYLDRIGMLTKHINDLHRQLHHLQQESSEIRASVREASAIQLPASSLFSESLIGRALTVYGHLVFAQILIAIPLVILSLIVSFFG